ncbi:zinc finger domain-containing protein [Streptomyces pseudovenezuelae]|uniref:zinc finger domain-containing protein n=1 Tax=Streptomyces pseudovenezuelae TaxID=67350 RepID=UPI0036E19845
MTLDETIDLLSQIALVDDRVVKVDEAEQRAQVTMWAAVLRDVPLQYAGQAVGEHYAASAYPVMPKDIAERWRGVVRDRLGRSIGTFEPGDHPHVDPDDEYGNAYVAALRNQRRSVAGGEAEPIGLRELLPAVGNQLGGGRIAELVPANDEFRATKEARYPQREQPKGPVERAVHCPACGASPDRPCRTTHRGRQMTGIHPSRRDAYEAAQATDSKGDPS